MTGTYELGYCTSCRRNVQHYRGSKSRLAQTMDALTLFILNFGPWYCSYCDRRTRSLPWVRKRQPTTNPHFDRAGDADRVGNFIRTDSSLVLRKKRAGRYSKKFREGVVNRLLTGRTTMSQVAVELEVTESDLLSWIHDLVESKDLRIEELTSLLRAYTRAATDLIGIDEDQIRFDDQENMIDANFTRRSSDRSQVED